MKTAAVSITEEDERSGKKKLSKAEWILDFLTVPGVFAAADSINNRAEHYLVEQGERQFLVSVTKEFITSVRLARRVTENKFDVGQNRFIKAAYSLHNKQ